MSARAGSASSRSAASVNANASSSSATSRRYRRVAHSPQVDDTLFGEKHHVAKSRRDQRTLQAGRDIVGGAPSNQEADEQRAVDAKAGSGRRAHQKPLVAVAEDDLERIKRETKILSPAQLEELQAARDAELERQRLSAKQRKEHMVRLSEEAARRAPKSEIEQVFAAEKEATLRRAAVLKDQAHDSVKLMKTLGARAQAFTIRDEQLKVHAELAEQHQVYDEKMNMRMEVERLEGLKRQEEVDESKKQKRYADRKVLEEQIEERRRQWEVEAGVVAQEAREMLAKIQRQQEEEADKERLKAARAHKTMEEIKHFNADTQARKAALRRQQQEEEERIVAYQLKKAEDQRRLEEEEAQRRHEAELRCAKLRSMQEKMANEKAELDELRAKRAAEGRERQAREADLALARKHKQEMEELRLAREAQAQHRQRAKVKEATLQHEEYASIMKQVELDKARVKSEEEKRTVHSMAHRRVLQQQIEDKARLQKLAFAKKQDEGRALKDEFARELDKLERIRVEEVEELVKAGVNPLYLSELKALDIAKARNR